MNILLWVLQILLGLQFLFAGVAHITLPETLPPMMSWIYDLSPGVNIFTGVIEIAGGLGLILPGLFKVQTRLTPFAAAGLIVTMVGAFVFHLFRAEYQNISLNFVLLALLAFIAYQRWKVNPLPEKAAAE